MSTTAPEPALLVKLRLDARTTASPEAADTIGAFRTMSATAPVVRSCTAPLDVTPVVPATVPTMIERVLATSSEPASAAMVPIEFPLWVSG